MRSLFALTLVALGTWANAQGRPQPSEGDFLVARTQIDEGPFRRSVVLLLAHGEDGTLGLVLDRPTDLLLSNAHPDLDMGEESLPLYLGGPLGLEGLLVVFRSEAPFGGAKEVMKGVYFTGDRDVLAKLLREGRAGDTIRVFIGHSGWARGQLDAELGKGAWDVLHADVFTLFRVEPERIWEHLRLGGRTIARSPALDLFARGRLTRARRTGGVDHGPAPGDLARGQ